MILVRWHGRGGQGAFTASKVLGAAAMLEGKYALAFPSFGPERRGAPIQAFTKISSHPVTDRSAIRMCDYIVYLDETLFDEKAGESLKENGLILVNTSKPWQYERFSYVIPYDAKKTAMEYLHAPITNAVMCGALAGLTNIVSEETMKCALEFYLPPKLAEKNKLAVSAARKEITDDKARTKAV